MGIKYLTIVEPDRQSSVDELVHHVLSMVRGGCHAKQFLAPGNRRVVDCLHVDLVLAHQIVGQLSAHFGISNLPTQRINITRMVKGS